MVGRGRWARLDEGQRFNILVLEGFPPVAEIGGCPASVEALTSKLTARRGSSGLFPNAEMGNTAANPRTPTWVEWQCVVCPLESGGAEAAWQAALRERGKEDRTLPMRMQHGTVNALCGAPEPLQHRRGLGLAAPLEHKHTPRGKHVGWRWSPRHAPLCFNKCWPYREGGEHASVTLRKGWKTSLAEAACFHVLLCSLLPKHPSPTENWNGISAFPSFWDKMSRRVRGASKGVSFHTTCSLLLKDCLRGWGCSWLKSTLEAVPCRGAPPDPVLLPPPLYRHLSSHSQAASQTGGASSQGNQSVWKLTHDPFFSAGSAHRSS